MSIYIPDSQSEPTPDDINIDMVDPSLNFSKEPSLKNSYTLSVNNFNFLFFDRYNLNYITDYFIRKKQKLQVVTNPKSTITCYEKSNLLGKWNPLNVIKALYFKYCEKGDIFAVVVPETGCFIDKAHLKEIIDVDQSCEIQKSNILPNNMDFGTCSPFITEQDLVSNGGPVRKIYFDTETLITKKYENLLDDFSFGTDHRLSVQMNYYHCYKMLKYYFGDAVNEKEILTLSFKEKFQRIRGRIKINYEFNTINYRTAKFINENHGFGDVSIANDFVDELDLPDVVINPAGFRNSH